MLRGELRESNAVGATELAEVRLRHEAELRLVEERVRQARYRESNSGQNILNEMAVFY